MIVRRSLFAFLVLLLAVGAAACGGDSGSDSPSTDAAKTGRCEPGALKLVKPGQLTIATDKPAYPPYFEDDDPTNGRGFESAVAYAIADQLGFKKDKVKWTTVPFTASYAPGPKAFDFDLNQISITPARERQVDFSTPYFEAPQAIVALGDSPAAKAGSLEELRDANLGVQVGTTSLAAVESRLKPTRKPQVFNDSNDTVRALKTGKVEAIVVDLPSAFYVTATQVEGAKIVGQFEAPGGDRWAALLAKDSPLTRCVSRAVRALRDAGTLDELQQRWLGGGAAPELR